MKVNEGGSIALFGDVMSKPRISRLIIQLKGNLGNPYGKLLQQPITSVVGYQSNTWYGQRMNERERLL